jgi:hypothetical protein
MDELKSMPATMAGLQCHDVHTEVQEVKVKGKVVPVF